MKNSKQRILVAGVGVSVMLAACGGGGGGSGSSSSSSNGNSTTALSADQQTFEQFTLAPNAAYEVSSGLPAAGTGAPQDGVHYLFESHASLAVSPATGSQALDGSAATSLAKTLSVPTIYSQRYLVNGAIYAAGSHHTISYQGAAIRDDELSGSGTAVAVSSLRTNLAIVPLSGTVAAAPGEFAQSLDNLYTNSTLLNTTTSWSSGASYLKFTKTAITDTYLVDDNRTVTVGNAPTPLATGTTIESMMASGGIALAPDGITYTLSNGSLSTINGVTTYVATNSQVGSTTTAENTSTPTYRTFYDLNGNVYLGDLVKAGTVYGGHVYVTTATSGSNTTYTNHYAAPLQIRLNAAAAASLSAAVTF